MNKILLVDDEKSFLSSLKDGLMEFQKDFIVLTANNGREALKILETEKIDLLVTDLRMPEMDGLELISKVANKLSELRIIIMTAYGSASVTEKLQSMGSFRYIEKPIDFENLADCIMEELSIGAKGYVQGITLSTFLQIFELEQKSATLIVKSKGKMGKIYVLAGKLIDAETGFLKGEEAIHEIISWEAAEIEIENKCKKKIQVIKTTLSNILMESVYLKDEKTRKSQKSIANEIKDETIKPTTKTKEDYEMAIKDELASFKELDDFIAVGVFSPTGEPLSLIQEGNHWNVKDVGAIANELLKDAKKAAAQVGAGAASMIHAQAEKAHILFRCHNEGSDPIKSEPGKAHIHVLVMLGSDNSLALAKMKIEALIKKAAEEFRS